MNCTASRNSAAALLCAIFLFALLPPPCDAAGSEYGRQTPGRPVPATLLAEALGLRAEFSPASAVLELEGEGKKAFIDPGTGLLYLGNRAVLMEERITAAGGELLLPAGVVDRLVGYFYGKPLHWRYEGNVFSVRDAPSPVPQPGEGGRRIQKPSPSAAREGQRNYEVDAVVIDAGHGGKDPGGVGRGGIKEKDIVLDVALELQRELRKRLGSRHVVVTRDGDEFLTLEERSGVANNLEPERNAVFVSVHANVSLDVKARGFESYFLSLDSYDETAREVASMENSVLSFEAESSSAYLKDIINRIVDMEYRRESRFLAEKIQSGLSGTAGRENDRGVKSAYFYVLKAVKMPSVLVEIGFVTNGEEAKKLVSADYKRRIARGIAEGIVDFVNAFRITEGFTKQGT